MKILSNAVAALLLASCGTVSFTEYRVTDESSKAAGILQSFALEHGLSPVSQSQSPPQMGERLGAYTEVGDKIAMNAYKRQGRVIIMIMETGSTTSDRFNALESAL